MPRTIDGWVDCLWLVYSCEGNGLEIGKFRLHATNRGSYIAEVIDLMPPYWDGLEFLPHGDEDVPTPELPLDPWKTENDRLWSTAAGYVRGRAALCTRHLVATFQSHDIILMRSDGAVTDQTPLLVLIHVPIKQLLDQTGGMEQDGTGHGGHN